MKNKKRLTLVSSVGLFDAVRRVLEGTQTLVGYNRVDLEIPYRSNIFRLYLHVIMGLEILERPF